MIQNDTFYFEKKENVCFGNGYFVNLEKGGPGKESWRFGHFHLLPQELKLFDGKFFFLFIFKSLQISLLVYLFLPIFLLLNAVIASSYKHIYFCTVTTSHSSHPFPIFQSKFFYNEVYLKLNEIKSIVFPFSNNQEFVINW